MSAFDNFMNIFFPHVAERRQNRMIEQRAAQNLQALLPFTSGMVQQPFQAEIFGPEDELAQLQAQGQSGLVNEFYKQGLFSRPEAQGFARMMAIPGMDKFGAALLSQMAPQQYKPKTQVVELPTGGTAQDGTPLMQKYVLDLNSGNKYPIGEVAPRGSGVNVNIDQTKAYSPAELVRMRMPDGTIPPPGTTPEDAKRLGIRVIEDVSPEEAGKRQALADAYRDVDTLRGFVFDDKGAVIRSNVANMAIGTPYTKGRTMTSLLRGAISAKVKAETGATANEEEIKDMMVRFDLSVLDDDATIKDKMDRLQNFMSQSLAQTSPELYNKLIQNSKNPPGVKTWTQDGYEYRQLPNGRIQRRKL